MSAPASVSGDVPPKINPDALVLRAKPPRVTRYKRHVIIGIAAIVVIGIMGASWMALSAPPLHSAASSPELYSIDHKEKADGLADFPRAMTKSSRLSSAWLSLAIWGRPLSRAKRCWAWRPRKAFIRRRKWRRHARSKCGMPKSPCRRAKAASSFAPPTGSQRSHRANRKLPRQVCPPMRPCHQEKNRQTESIQRMIKMHSNANSISSTRGTKKMSTTLTPSNFRNRPTKFSPDR
jgi:hypothetical protein